MPTLQRQKLKLKNYEKLRGEVRERISLGRTRMEEESVTTYHEVRTMIVSHCDGHSANQKYGDRVVGKTGDSHR